MTHASNDPLSSAREALWYASNPLVRTVGPRPNLLRPPIVRVPNSPAELRRSSTTPLTTTPYRARDSSITARLNPSTNANTPAPANARAVIVRPPTLRDGRAKIQ